MKVNGEGAEPSARLTVRGVRVRGRGGHASRSEQGRSGDGLGRQEGGSGRERSAVPNLTAALPKKQDRITSCVQAWCLMGCFSVMSRTEARPRCSRDSEEHSRRH